MHIDSHCHIGAQHLGQERGWGCLGIVQVKEGTDPDVGKPAHLCKSMSGLEMSQEAGECAR